MTMTHDATSYDWNWAEQEEQEAAREERRSRLLERCPDLALFNKALHSPHDPASRTPDLDLTTPSEYDLAPAHLGFVACCMLNEESFHALAWLDWAMDGQHDARVSQLCVRALDQIRNNHGPLSLLAPEILNRALDLIDKLPGKAHAWANVALVRLFQPLDVGNDNAEAEELLLSKPCKLLLSRGAIAGFRDDKGNSALSGINFLLTEAEVSMAEPARINDLMLCAEMLLDAGASPDGVRVLPPIADLVPNEHFRAMLHARNERSILIQASEEESPEPAAIAEETGRAGKSKRL